MISADIEAAILTQTYYDKMEVYRQTTTVTDGEATESEELIAEDVPCALSKLRIVAPDDTEPRGVIKYQAEIFHGVTIKLLGNDRVVITKREGDVYEGNVGDSFYYCSHYETALNLHRIA